MSSRTRILFVSHDTSLTGAPILLLNLLKLVKQFQKFEPRLILKRDGVLAPKFLEVCEGVVLKNENYGRPKSMIGRLVEFIQYKLTAARKLHSVAASDLIFSNTITNGLLLHQLRRLKLPVITYVHELESVISEFDKKKEIYYTMLYSDFFVCPSQAVADNLHRNHGVSKDRIGTLRYYFPKPAFSQLLDGKGKARQVISKKYNVSTDVPWIVGMGTITRRKGVDIFAELCAILNREKVPVHFFWIGAQTDAEYFDNVNAFISAEKLNHQITFTGILDYSPETLFPFDLFCLSSREDPYPLVVLEAAYNFVPSICFAQSGGIAEFVEEGCGWKVSNFSTASMAREISLIIGDKAELHRIGKNAYHRAVSWHSDGGQIINQLNLGIQKSMTFYADKTSKSNI